MNSLLPLNARPTNATNTNKSWFTSSNTNATNSKPFLSGYWIGILVFLVIAAILITLGVIYQEDVKRWWKEFEDLFNPPPAAEAAVKTPPPAEPAAAEAPADASHGGAHEVVSKILPGTGGSSEIFNVSSNNYTFSDAEPLCKALGAELATYDQVKAAWAKGADWCNYGWVKGQMAVYPTSDETYQKLQAGPEDQRMACGRPGLNGGYFDNPDMRFGVTCVGTKPPQSTNDESDAAAGVPSSPDVLEFDKKVNRFKTNANHIGLLPFNNKKWTS